MFIGDLLPAALAAWMPRRALRPASVQVGRLPTAFPLAATAVAPEIRNVLAAARDLARGRFVELQMAVEPGLVAQVDAAACRVCLRDMLFGAIGRASSGVLVTAMRQADGVEITVLDDGAAPAAAPPDCSARPAANLAVPCGGTLTADYQAGRGTTMLLRLPRPPDAAAFDAVAAAAGA